MQTSGVSFRTRNGDLQRLYDAAEARSVVLEASGVRTELTVLPNQVYRLAGAGARLLRAVPFDVPYRPR